MNQTIIKHLARYTVIEDGNIRIYEVDPTDIVHVCTVLYREKSTELKTIVARDMRQTGEGFRIYYIFGLPKEQVFFIPYIRLGKGTDFPSLTKYIHEASGYERKIHSLMGLTPVGHPDLRPFILHENWPGDMYPLRKDFPATKRPQTAKGEYVFGLIKGEGIYEIPVGPVHAGIIEPGHFRFSVAGEEILHLEPKLGYKHRGVEKLFETIALPQMLRLSERVSGDTSFTHSLAFCQAMEDLAGIKIPQKALMLRVIYSELERLANHVNDIGCIMLDTGYSFGGSHGTRLKEVIMQWNERATGSRFLRGTNAIGGVTRDISREQGVELIGMLDAFETDFRQVIDVASESSSLYNRLEGTGKLDVTVARDHGVVGVAARALGIARDARKDYPYAAYPTIPFTLSLQKDGDVRARFGVRVKEVYESIAIITRAVKKLSAGTAIAVDQPIKLKRNALAIGITEGWRGEIVYTVITDNEGKVTRVDVRDPSFLNWPVVGFVGKSNVVPDFPLINKSFNLSYAGHDL